MNEFLVLHAVRLGGCVEPHGICLRTGLPEETVVEALEDVRARGLVERFAFGQSGGWIVTERGRAQDDAWAQESAAPCGDLLATTLDRFDVLNGRLVATVTAWQLREPTVLNASRETIAAAHSTFRTLSDIGTSLESVLKPLATALPRFARYPVLFSDALRRLEAGHVDSIAGVGTLSCHTVWAELHQDLLSTAGRQRGASADDRAE